MRLLTNRKYFLLFFIFYVFMNTLSLGYFGITRNPLYVVVFAWGLLILGNDLIRKQLFYKNSHLGIIGLYGVILFIATFLNKEYSNTDSYIIWGMQMLIFLLVFGKKKNMTLATMKEEIRAIIPFTTILTIVASGLSLLMFFLNIALEKDGYYLGLVGGRLFGVYFNCNPAAFLACIMMVFSMIAIKNKYQYRLLYYANFAVQLLYIILSGCRTALLVVMCIALAILYFKLFREHGFSRIKQIGVSLLVCIMVLFGSNIVQQTLYVIPQLQGATSESGSRFQFDKIIEIVQLVKEAKSSNIPIIYNLLDEVSSGRVELLNTSRKVFMVNPLQGAGVNNFQRMGMVVSPNDRVVKQKQVVHTHNVFVESAVVGGMFGFVLFFLFFLRSSATIYSVFKKYNGSSSYLIVMCFFLIVVSDFLGGMLDYGVFYVYSLSSTLSWLFLGYLYWLNEHSALALTSHSKHYDFMYYNLSKIEYERSANEVFEEVRVSLLHSALSKDVYALRVDVMLKFKNKQSHFIYDAFFKVYANHKEVSLEEENGMMLELYEMIKVEIATLVSDGNGVMYLPEGNVGLIKDKKENFAKQKNDDIISVI